jgi:malate synthase
MRATVSVDELEVDQALYDFVNSEAIPGSGVQVQTFWNGFASLVRTLAPRNAELLRKRDELQAKIDAWHRQNPGPGFDHAKYKTFLSEIGYLVREGAPFAVSTANVDTEIALIAGPQLVVPVSNARYALNAANARWGSLYDALYGTDAIPEDGAPRGGKYNPQRGAKVIAFARDFLDQNFALANGSHHDSVAYRVAEHGLEVSLKSNQTTRLKQSAAFRGFRAGVVPPTSCCLSITACTWNCTSIERTISAAMTRPESAMSCSNPRSRRFRIARTRSPQSMPRTKFFYIAIGWD